jgi:predicted transcriptional regulator
MSTMVGIGLCWWALLYLPTKQNLLSTRNERHTLVQRQKAVLQITQEIKHLNQTINNLTYIFQQSSINKKSYKTILNELLVKGIESGMSLYSCVIHTPKNEGWYSIHEAEISFSGTFETLQHYLKTISGDEYPIQTKHIKLEKKNDSTLLITQTIALVHVHKEVS